MIQVNKMIKIVSVYKMLNLNFNDFMDRHYLVCVHKVLNF